MAETILEQQVRRTEGQESFSSEDVVGKRVKNPEGYDLGEISSLRIGLPTGKVAYAVLKTGGVFGLGAKFFAVPIEAMVYRPGDDVFVANISKYKLDNEPGFSEGDWPREANWSLIESRRPMGPPSQEEARAVTRTEAPPREVVTTERVEVREGMPIRAEEVEEGRARMAVPVTEPAPHETVTTERVEVREKPTTVEEVETRPVTEAHAPTIESMTRAEKEAVERPVTTGGPSLAHLPAADLQVYLKGMDYPAGKQDLITHARERSAPE
ncbi:PRC-barrel domain-containing protein, partial [Methanoculleus sp.]|uniref:PRC-barrel domain-containing protein n=1 Tax=Methanoculleus sp. TaxID=90427 RepID=UPI0025F51F52